MIIGPSTSPSTATNRTDIGGSGPASFRYNNPGAQYPSEAAAKFGQTGYGIIGGGHKIAAFPSPVNGAAANFDLLYRNYTGMTLGAAGKKWTGSNGSGVPGYDDNEVLTKEWVADPAKAIPLLKAFAGRESGKGNNLTEDQWKQAHAMFKAGSADAYLKTAPDTTQPPIVVEPDTRTGAGLLRRAREHIGEKYVNVQVPKDNPDWHGPWDCAEFISWLVYQEAGILYGCVDDNAAPAKADAYTGAWKADAERLGKLVSVEEAAATVGGILLRYPPSAGAMGHIVLCDGRGGTVEAKGARYGVVADTVQGRRWDTGVLVPGIAYEDSGKTIPVDAPASLYRRGAPNMSPAVITAIQEALQARGYNVGPDGADGDFGENTEQAVLAFQGAEGLTVDGEVGPETAAALGVSLDGLTVPVPTEPQPPEPWPPQEPQGPGLSMTDLLALGAVAIRIMGLVNRIPRGKTLVDAALAIEEGLKVYIYGPPKTIEAAPVYASPSKVMAVPAPVVVPAFPPGKPTGVGPMNSAQIMALVRLLFGAGGPIAAWLLSKGVDPSNVVSVIEWLLGAGGPIIAAIWSMFTHSPTNQVKAAAALPGVTVGVDPSEASQALVDVAKDRSQPKVLATTPAR